MRKVVVSALISVDGYFEQEGHDLSALPFDDGFNRHNLAVLERAGTMLMGRVGYEGFASYWPGVEADESRDPVERAIARLNNPMPKLVVSDSLEAGTDAPWASTTRVVRRADAADAVAALRREDGGDVVVFGSATTWAPLAEAGLVDELLVLVGPALLGEGVPLYRGARVVFRLLDAGRLDDSQLVLLRYAPA